MPDLLGYGSFRPAPPDEIRDYKPMNDEATITLAALLASLKIDIRRAGWPEACLFAPRHDPR